MTMPQKRGTHTPSHRPVNGNPRKTGKEKKSATSDSIKATSRSHTSSTEIAITLDEENGRVVATVYGLTRHEVSRILEFPPELFGDGGAYEEAPFNIIKISVDYLPNGIKGIKHQEGRLIRRIQQAKAAIAAGVSKKDQLPISSQGKPSLAPIDPALIGVSA